MPALIEFQNVTRVFHNRVTALAGVSFEVEPGEVCAFLGPNGAGKTTTINILMGFLFPDSGDVRVLGLPPGDVRAKEKIGFLPENFAFYKHLTAPKLLRFHLTLSGQNSPPDTCITELLARLKLNGYEDLPIGKYSRGMVQRLGIAQALLADPELLILDEPTSGLDPAGRREVLELLASLKAAGKTVFISSHILSEVEQICDRVVVINRGSLVRTGLMKDLLGTGDRVEIIVDRLSEEHMQEAVRIGAALNRTAEGVRLEIDSAQKRALEELLYSAGAEIVGLRLLRNSLEDLFLKLVEDHHTAGPPQSPEIKVESQR
jgi:ABC-2 type transport system ATP-binding protein